MSHKQYALLKYIHKHGIVSVNDLSGEEQQTLRYLLGLKYVEAIQDETPYRNFTEFHQITQSGEAALADYLRSTSSIVMSIIAIMISATTLILNIVGII